MGVAIEVTRSDYTADDLRYHASKSVDGAQVRRLLALAWILEGRCRGEAAAHSGMDRQTLCDWVHRYNAAGIDGLKSHRSRGRAPVLSTAQMAELRALVVAGPDPAEHKVVRWRCVDLQAEVSRRFSVEVHENTIGRVWDTYDDIVEACSIAWRFLTDDPQRIRSIGHRKWACVSL